MIDHLGVRTSEHQACKILNTKSSLLQIPAQWYHRKTKLPNVQTSPHISVLNSKINSPLRWTTIVINLREKFSCGLVFELGSPALRAGALTNWATQMIRWDKLEFFSYSWPSGSSTQWIVWVAQLVRALARRTGDPGSNPGPGENFSLKLTTQDLKDGYSKR